MAQKIQILEEHPDPGFENWRPPAAPPPQPVLDSRPWVPPGERAPVEEPDVENVPAPRGAAPSARGAMPTSPVSVSNTPMASRFRELVGPTAMSVGAVATVEKALGLIDQYIAAGPVEVKEALKEVYAERDNLKGDKSMKAMRRAVKGAGVSALPVGAAVALPAFGMAPIATTAIVGASQVASPYINEAASYWGRKAGLTDEQAGLAGDVAEEVIDVAGFLKAGRKALPKGPREGWTSNWWDTWIKALPPTRTNNYTKEQTARAVPHFQEAVQGKPITTHVQAVDAGYDASAKLDSVVKEISNKLPNAMITTNPIAAIRARLGNSPSYQFMQRGLSAVLADLPQLNGPLSLKDADSIRHYLNSVERKALGDTRAAKGDMATADPVFAARRAVIDSLLNGIYDGFEKAGVKGVRELRQDHAAVLELRHRIEANLHKGEQLKPGQAGGRIREAVGAVGHLGAAVWPTAAGRRRIGAASEAIAGRETYDDALARAFAEMGDWMHPTYPQAPAGGTPPGGGATPPGSIFPGGFYPGGTPGGGGGGTPPGGAGGGPGRYQGPFGPTTRPTGGGGGGTPPGGGGTPRTGTSGQQTGQSALWQLVYQQEIARGRGRGQARGAADAAERDARRAEGGTTAGPAAAGPSARWQNVYDKARQMGLGDKEARMYADRAEAMFGPQQTGQTGQTGGRSSDPRAPQGERGGRRRGQTREWQRLFDQATEMGLSRTEAEVYAYSTPGWRMAYLDARMQRGMSHDDAGLYANRQMQGQNRQGRQPAAAQSQQPAAQPPAPEPPVAPTPEPPVAPAPEPVQTTPAGKPRLTPEQGKEMFRLMTGVEGRISPDEAIRRAIERFPAPPPAPPAPPQSVVPPGAAPGAPAPVQPGPGLNIPFKSPTQRRLEIISAARESGTEMTREQVEQGVANWEAWDKQNPGTPVTAQQIVATSGTVPSRTPDAAPAGAPATPVQQRPDSSGTDETVDTPWEGRTGEKQTRGWVDADISLVARRAGVWLTGRQHAAAIELVHSGGLTPTQAVQAVQRPPGATPPPDDPLAPVGAGGPSEPPLTPASGLIEPPAMPPGAEDFTPDEVKQDRASRQTLDPAQFADEEIVGAIREMRDMVVPPEPPPAAPPKGKKKVTAPVSDPRGVIVGHEIDTLKTVRGGGYKAIYSTDPNATAKPLFSDEQRIMLERMFDDMDTYLPQRGRSVNVRKLGSDARGNEESYYSYGHAGSPVSEDLRILSGAKVSNLAYMKAIKELLDGKMPTNRIHLAALDASQAYIEKRSGFHPPTVPSRADLESMYPKDDPDFDSLADDVDDETTVRDLVGGQREDVIESDEPDWDDIAPPEDSDIEGAPPDQEFTDPDEGDQDMNEGPPGLADRLFNAPDRHDGAEMDDGTRGYIWEWVRAGYTDDKIVENVIPRGTKMSSVQAEIASARRAAPADTLDTGEQQPRPGPDKLATVTKMKDGWLMDENGNRVQYVGPPKPGETPWPETPEVSRLRAGLDSLSDEANEALETLRGRGIDKKVLAAFDDEMNRIDRMPRDTNEDVLALDRALNDLANRMTAFSGSRVDRLDTGEQQSRLPGDVGDVRDQDVQTPEIDSEFGLTPEVGQRPKGTTNPLFGPDDEARTATGGVDAELLALRKRRESLLLKDRGTKNTDQWRKAFKENTEALNARADHLRAERNKPKAGPAVDLQGDWIIDADGNRVDYVGFDQKIKREWGHKDVREAGPARKPKIDRDALLERVRANPEGATGDELRVLVKHLNNQRSEYMRSQDQANRPWDKRVLGRMEKEIETYRKMAQQAGHGDKDKHVLKEPEDKPPTGKMRTWEVAYTVKSRSGKDSRVMTYEVQARSAKEARSIVIRQGRIPRDVKPAPPKKK